MATKRKRKPPEGHGTVTRYTAGCRCEWCKAAQSKSVREYRERTYSKVKCRAKNCPRQAAFSTGNGLCRRHDVMLKERRERAAKAKRRRKRAAVKA